MQALVTLHYQKIIVLHLALREQHIPLTSIISFMSSSHKFMLRVLLKLVLFGLRIYGWMRQTKNKERMVAGLFVIPSIFLLIPTISFEITLLQSFLFQAMLAYGIFSIIWILKRHYRVAGTNFIIYLLLLIKVSGPLGSTLNVRQGQEELSVLQFNLLTRNTSYNETITRVKQLEPDLISFQEVSNTWATKLEDGLGNLYPYHRIAFGKDEGQGIAIFSKHPLVDVEVYDWIGTKNITGKIQLNQEEVNFVALHTRSPMTKDRYQNRNEHLKIAEDYIAQTEGEFLVLGDFNTVPWDKRLVSFRSSTNLKDSRKRLTPTYPTWNPFIAQIPIDYIFHSDGIGCDSLNAVRITSDHKAIMGSFLLK